MADELNLKCFSYSGHTESGYNGTTNYWGSSWLFNNSDYYYGSSSSPSSNALENALTGAGISIGVHAFLEDIAQQICSLRNNENQQITDDGDSVKNVITSPTSYEICPRFPEGEKALFDFIKNNMSHPKCAKEKRIDGRVIVSFYVETDGSLTNISIAKSADSRLDKEALLIIKKMPKWEPGQLGGKIVRMKYFLPIEFRCQDSTNDSIMILSPIIRN